MHEKAKKYDTETIENDFVRSCLVTTTTKSRFADVLQNWCS